MSGIWRRAMPKKQVTRLNNLAVTHPYVATQWHPTKNGGNRSSSGKQRRKGWPAAMSADCLAEIFECILVMQTTGLYDRQNAVDETAARCAVATKAASAPQHRAPHEAS